MQAGWAKRVAEDSISTDAPNTTAYLLASALGLFAGIINVKFGDLLLTALFVLSSTMLLGALHPERPWRWTLLVGIMVPCVQLAAFLLFRQKPYRAQIYESFLGFVSGIAGAYGGALGRRARDTLFAGK
jgi:hypothetical protein